MRRIILPQKYPEKENSSEFAQKFKVLASVFVYFFIICLLANYSDVLESNNQVHLSNITLPFLTTKNKTRDPLRNFMRRQNTTQLRIKKVCEKYRDDLTGLYNSGRYMIDLKHGLTMCIMPKVASSTWMEYLNRSLESKYLASKLTKANIYTKLLRYFSIDALVKASKTHQGLYSASGLNKFNSDEGQLAFSYVRNPLDRIVSAFENKMLGKDDVNGQFTKMRAFVNGSFPLFVDYIEEQIRNCSIKDQMNKTCRIDFHWLPMYRICDFCGIKYDVIGRLEHFDEDTEGLMNKRSELKDEIFQGQNVSSVRMNWSKRDTKKRNQYFAQLTTKQKHALIHAYKYDFALFGYNKTMK